MTIKILPALAVCIGLSTTALAADVAYQATVSNISAQVLFDQHIDQSGIVTVKPQSFRDAQGDVEALEQCLWSVQVQLDSGKASFSAGKMICIGPEQEVLEAIPTGVISLDGQCSDTSCTGFDVTADAIVEMSVSAPVQLSVQARNERK
jgi:hypothetical protein